MLFLNQEHRVRTKIRTSYEIVNFIKNTELQNKRVLNVTPLTEAQLMSPWLLILHSGARPLSSKCRTPVMPLTSDILHVFTPWNLISYIPWISYMHDTSSYIYGISSYILWHINLHTWSISLHIMAYHLTYLAYHHAYYGYHFAYFSFYLAYYSYHLALYGYHLA